MKNNNDQSNKEKIANILYPLIWNCEKKEEAKITKDFNEAVERVFNLLEVKGEEKSNKECEVELHCIGCDKIKGKERETDKKCRGISKSHPKKWLHCIQCDREWCGNCYNTCIYCLDNNPTNKHKDE